MTDVYADTYEPPRITERTVIDVPLVAVAASATTISATFRPL